MTEPTAGSLVDESESLARRLLAREGGMVLAAEKLSSHLGRIVGQQGIDALFARSLLLTRHRFSWLTCDPHEDEGTRWCVLHAVLAAQAADPAHEASICLIAHVLRLLGSLIGEALLRQLLVEVWPDDIPLITPR